MLQESLIYRFLYMIFSYFSEKWNESLSACALRKCGSYFRVLFSGSVIMDFFGREGVVSRAYDGSILFKFVNWLINFPQHILHPFYKRLEQVFRESFLFKVLIFILERLHMLIAGFLFIALIVPHQSWNNLYSTAAMAVLLLMYFLKTIVDGKTGFQTGIFSVYLVLFVICVMLGEVFSIIPAASLRFLAFYLTCFLLVLLLMVTIRTKKDMSAVLGILLAGMSVAGLYGVYQKIVGIPVNASWIDTTVNQGSMVRVYSFFDNPNNFAEIIIMLLPFYLAAVFNTRRLFMKLIYLALAVPPFLALLLTLTRSAWIAFAIAGLVYVFFKEKRLIPVFILLGILSIPFLPQSIILRLRTIINPADSSSETRVQLYQTVLPILKDYWFTGLGLGNETLLRVSRNYFSFIANGSIPSHSHNLYLQVWFETGFPGILSFLAFLGATVKKSIKSIVDSSGDLYVNNILIAGLSSLSCILAMGMVEYVWFYPRVMLIFWVIVGIILAALSLRVRIQETDVEKDMQNELNDAEQEVA